MLGIAIGPKLIRIEEIYIFSNSSPSGNVLTLGTDGEPELIPSEIMKYSLDQAPNVNVDTSLRVLASPGQPSTDIPGHEATDPVILLVSSVFKLAEVEKRAVEAGFAGLCSPEVLQKRILFCSVASQSYLIVIAQCPCPVIIPSSILSVK